MTHYNKLPTYAAVNHPETGEVVLIMRGMGGYYSFTQPSLRKITAEEFNHVNGVTAQQQSAMLHGSMFGWECPGADPDNPINQSRPKAIAVAPTKPDEMEDGIKEMARQLAPGGGRK